MQNVANAQFSVNLALGIDTCKNTIDSGGVFFQQSVFICYLWAFKPKRQKILCLNTFALVYNMFKRFKKPQYKIKSIQKTLVKRETS